ncbi:MAG TPA: outer membrane protein transport protein [Rhodocyclaceae bacterium]|nr:outer membrane protein transport protein [Rhodocyclaceae bacterium]
MTLKKIAALLAIAGIASPAFATNGYFAHGYGMKALGMAGVGIAMPQDSLAAATNPAGMVMVGDRLDVGLDWFRPTRGADISGTGTAPGPGQLGIDGSYDGNGKKNFFIPEFGYNKMLNSNLSLGVSVYGNGGMNTQYDKSPFATGAFTGAGTNPAGVDLMQLFVAPTVAYKINADHAVGLSINLAYQRFKAEGLQAFGGMSSDASNLTNNGYDSSTGYGARIGWTGRVAPNVTLGATYQTRTNMGKLDKYKGLFAEQGDFDIPENYGAGIAVKVMPQLTIAADVEQINYSKIKSIANSVTAGGPLGASNGAGFGWRDMTVLKLGVSYDLGRDMVLRAGFSHAKQPIPEKETFFNILAPGVVQDHLTLGGTWTLANKSELTVGYMHAFKKTVNGSGSVAAATGGAPGEANLRMYQDSLGVGYGVKF